MRFKRIFWDAAKESVWQILTAVVAALLSLLILGIWFGAPIWLWCIGHPVLAIVVLAVWTWVGVMFFQHGDDLIAAWRADHGKKG